MKRKRHGTDEVIRKLREAEGLEAQGQSVGQVSATFWPPTQCIRATTLFCSEKVVVRSATGKRRLDIPTRPRLPLLRAKPAHNVKANALQ